MPRYPSGFLALCLVFALGCGDDSDESDGDTGPTGPTTPSGGARGTVTALVDGEPSAAATILFAGLIDGDLSVISANANAAGNETTIESSVDGTTAGTYAIEGFGGDTGGLYTAAASQSLFSTALGGTGTIAVTQVAAIGIAGIFEFTAPNSLLRTHCSEPTAPNSLPRTCC